MLLDSSYSGAILLGVAEFTQTTIVSRYTNYYKMQSNSGYSPFVQRDFNNLLFPAIRDSEHFKLRCEQNPLEVRMFITLKVTMHLIIYTAS
jgi:hypothetical protein